MQLEASCHCGAVSFVCNSVAPRPFMHCYCSICRKTAGGGGFAINLHADAESLHVTGGEHITVYRAYTDFPARHERSPGERRFCRQCGSCLWVWDPRWPELIHPFASAVDTPLPTAPERDHIMLDHAPDWVSVPESGGDRHFGAYPDQSLVDWHASRGLLEGSGGPSGAS